MAGVEDGLTFRVKFTTEGEKEAAAGFEKLKQGQDNATASLQAFSGIAMTGIHIMTRLESNAIRVEMANNRLTDAQELYNASLAKNGPNAKETEKAARALENAQKNLYKANMMTNASYLLIGATALAQIPKLIALAGAEWAVAAATRAVAVAAAGLTGVGLLFMLGSMVGGGMNFGQKTSYISVYQSNTISVPASYNAGQITGALRNIVHEEFSSVMSMRGL